MNTNFKQSVVYQIYPKSFQDSNGDGIGDIQGIISRLDYLQSLGVDYLWLTPMYVSPQNDNGYDIADYYNIDPLYGTMGDFDALLAQAHEQHLKIIMDIVVNHTSTAHHWFQEAKSSRENKYHDYYIWREEPNNWQSKFGGNAWEFNEATGEYYLHLFDKTQADLNWENEAMRQDIYQMMRWWLEKGIDGFRLDVVNLLSKDQQFLNDTLDSAMADGRKYYTDGPRIHEFLHEMNTEVFAKYPGTLTVGEMSSTSLDSCIGYTNPKNKELEMVFNFHHLKVDYAQGNKWTQAPVDFQALKQLFTTWQVGMHEGGGWNALFWGNHDQPRPVSRFANDTNYRYESATMLATVLHGMQGTPYIYQGEEYGITNAYFDTIEQYRDIESLNAYDMLMKQGMDEQTVLGILADKSRDNGRTPIQWDTTTNGGFSTSEPWVPIGNTAAPHTIAADLASKQSIIAYYRKLIQLRKQYTILAEGNYVPQFQNHEQIFAYSRHFETETLVVLANFGESVVSLDLSAIIPDDANITILANNYEESVFSKEIKLAAFECYMILVQHK